MSLQHIGVGNEHRLATPVLMSNLVRDIIDTVVGGNDRDRAVTGATRRTILVLLLAMLRIIILILLFIWIAVIALRALIGKVLQLVLIGSFLWLCHILHRVIVLNLIFLIDSLVENVLD